MKLLWWQKDDTETRAFIVALEWCQLAVPAKENDPWPAGIDDFEAMARRFDGPERALRLHETDFVRAHRGTIARELGIILSTSKIKLGKSYGAWSEVLLQQDPPGDVLQLNRGRTPSLSSTQIVEKIYLIKELVPKTGEPESDPCAAAIVALGHNAGPLLAEKLVDERDSPWAYGFQYKIADVANALLCDIYRQDPAGALIARKPPVNPQMGYYFADYAALTSTREGREALRDAWRKIIAEAERKPTALNRN